MRRDIYLFSSMRNGTPTTIGFKKSFESSADPPLVGTIVALGSEGESEGTLKQGVVTNVRVTANSVQIKVGTEVSTDILRNCLAKSGWEEVALPNW